MSAGRSSFGMVLLLVVMAVVLVLVAQAWQKFGPAAISVTDPGSASVSDHGQATAAEQLRSGDLPRLDQMQESTDAHADKIQNALEATE